MMQRLIPLVVLFGVGVLVLGAMVPVALSALQTIVLAPGDDLTINCSTTLTGSPSGQQATFTCLPEQPSTPVPTLASPTGGGGGGSGGGGGGGGRGGAPLPVTGGGGAGGVLPISPPPASGANAPPNSPPNPPPVTITQPAQDAAAPSPSQNVTIAETQPFMLPVTLPETLTLNPITGGAIASPGGRVVVAIPGGASSAAAFTVSVGVLDPSGVVPTNTSDNLGLSGNIFELLGWTMRATCS